MENNIILLETGRFLRHAAVPFVTWLVTSGTIEAGDHQAVVEAIAIGGSYLVIYVWSKIREQNKAKEKPDA